MFQTWIMRIFIKLLIFIYFLSFLISFSYSDNLILEEINIESNFLNLINFNELTSLSSINLGKDFYFINGNITFLSSTFFKFDLKGSLEIFYSINTNKSTSNLIDTILRNKPLTIGENYNISANMEGYTLIGFSFSKMFKLGILSFSLTPKLIYGIDIQKGNLIGDFIRLDDESYKFNLHLDYLFHKNYVFKTNIPQNGFGIGYSIDTEFNLDLSSTLKVQLKIRNTFGKIYWKNIRFLTLNANSEREFFDEYGHINFRPLISGYEISTDFTQPLPKLTSLTVGYINPPILVFYIINHNNKLINYSLTFSYIITNKNYTNMFIFPNQIKLNKNYDSINISLAGDKNSIYNILFYLSTIY